jgi:tetratricopeptide (TPR) repeat protein
MSRFSVRSLFAELRRRRVFNTTLLFIIGAWGALQVSELTFPALDIPDRAIRWVWLAAFALLPLVLAFGWRYDISTGGIRRTAPAAAPEDAETSLKAPDRWLIGLFGMAAAAVLSVAGYHIAVEEPPPEILLEPTDHRIAVLPFRACPSSVTAGDLAYSVASEVISRLAARDFVEVLGGNSSFWLADQGLLPAEIADRLSANFLLSGLLCDSEGELTLQVELSEAQGGIQMRERFEQQVNAFEQVEELLSSRVAQRVAAEFGDVLPAREDTAVSQEALLELRRGREWRRQGRRNEARAAFEKALELQPDYAEAQYALAGLEFSGSLDDQQAMELERARPLLERALDMARRQLRLDPRSAQAHYAIGSIRAALARAAAEPGRRDADDGGTPDRREARAEAERHLRQAITADPSLLDAHLALAGLLPRTQASDRLEVLERAARIEPFAVELILMQAETLLELGRYPEAMETLQRIREPLEVPVDVWHKRMLYPWLTGRQDEAFTAVVATLRHYPPGAAAGTRVMIHAAGLAATLAQLGLMDAADAWWSRLEGALPSGLDRDFARTRYLLASGRAEDNAAAWAGFLAGRSEEELLQAPRPLIEHLVTPLVDAGELQRAIRLLEKVRITEQEWDLRMNEADFWMGETHLWLAELYRRDGQAERAEQELAQTVQSMEKLLGAGIRSRTTLNLLAQGYALQGRGEQALETLSRAYDYHLYPNSRDTLAPWYRPFAALEDDPRYQALQERVAIEYQRQARNIERMLEGLDLDRLFAAIRPASYSN